MIAILPELKSCYLLVVGSAEAKSAYEPIFPAFLYVLHNGFDDALARELLEVTKHIANGYAFLCPYNHVQMIAHQHPCINVKPFI